MYNPNEDYQTNVKPLCRLTSVLVNDSISFPVDSMVHVFYYNQNKFLFSFDGLSFIDEDKVQFEYYLEPLEKPWSSITHQRKVNYSFLKSGNYSFHVRVKNPSGFISNPQSISFTIETPFWEERWFYILSIILLIGFGYLFNYYRLQRIKRNNLQLEKLVNQKTNELKNSRDKIAKQYKSLVEAQKQLVEKEKLEKSYKEIEILKNRLSIENIYLKEKQTKVFEVESIIGKSKVIQQIRKQIIEVADTDATVLVTGKTGSGKNLVVEAIHALSLRKDRTLISVNCAAIPEGLIESELFGHEKGAFTGANERRIGKFEIANGSTIFLDEIGDMDINLQSKILTVLQEKKITRIGGNKSINVDVRVIAATNYFLEDMVKKGKFRSDLYYRINVFQIYIPPLSERMEDVEILTKFLVDKYSRSMNKKITGITKSALKKLNNYNFPGNIRELENIIQRSLIICRTKVITDEDIVIQTDRENELYEMFSDNTLMSLEQLERKYIVQVLKTTAWKIYGKGGAAEILKLHPNTLRSRMTKLKIPFSPNNSDNN
jgi:transcriptional regulator with GAF, ATPase, and Fis domain